MSILIKDREIPERCGQCFLRGDCNQRIYMEQRPKACPLAEIAEPHWIPVTERLPKEEGFYLVTLGYKHGAETNIRFFKTESGKRYWRLWRNENITAWMPLPEPYKGVTDGRD